MNFCLNMFISVLLGALLKGKTLIKIAVIIQIVKPIIIKFTKRLGKTEVIDRLDNSTLIDARIREEALRKEYNANMNSIKCHTTDEEKKQQKKEWMKEWHENNKNETKEYLKEWYENNKEKQKEYRENNKEKQKEYANKKFTCVCGCEFSKSALSSHKKSQKHQNFCKSINLSDT